MVIIVTSDSKGVVTVPNVVLVAAAESIASGSGDIAYIGDGEIILGVI